MNENKDSKNLLFYGNFTNLKENEYVEGLTNLMYSGDELYKTIAKDTYYLGLVIDSQYRYLRTSFNIFLVGIFIAVISFVMCHVLYA